MKEEAQITIDGCLLTEAQSTALRVAVGNELFRLILQEEELETKSKLHLDWLEEVWERLRGVQKLLTQ